MIRGPMVEGPFKALHTASDGFWSEGFWVDRRGPGMARPLFVLPSELPALERLVRKMKAKVKAKAKRGRKR